MYRVGYQVSAKEKDKQSFDLLYQVSQIVISDRYLDEILGLVVGLTAQITDSKICSLMLVDEKTQKLVIKATQSLSPAYRGKAPIKVNGSFSGQAIESLTPVTTLDVLKEKNYQYPDIARSEGLKSLVAVPLILRKKAIGVLNCYTSEEKEFTQEEIRLLIAIASQACMAIENAALTAEKELFSDMLETRKKVERAKAILIKKKGMTEDTAHRFLQQHSMEKRRSIREVAESIILSESL